MVYRDFDLDQINADFEKKKPQEIVAWAIKEFKGSIAMTSSFGPESGVLLHMVSEIDPATPVLFLETGYHFPETLQYRDELIKMFGLTNLRNLRADEARKAKVVADHDGVPYEKDPDLCCQVNKVEPLDLELKNYEAWMTGIRRHQTGERSSVRIVEQYEGGRYKISPLVNFTSRDAWYYLKERKVPEHPLYEKGYLSIGCWPCTRPVQEGDDERSGRWAGKSKRECGIHTFMKEEKTEAPKPEDTNPDAGANI